jgi:hypothetical protein
MLHPAIRSRAAALAALGAALLSGGCVSPNALADLQNQLNQAADAVNDIRVNLSIMQETIDSLKTVVARQDTTISRLANATGVQVVK